VIVIVGLLAAIALPSFLNQAAKAKQARALKYIGVINRAQQAYFLEHDDFAPSIAVLGIAGQDNDNNYTYSIPPATPTPTGLMTSTKATPTSTALRGYAGVVFTTVDPSGGVQLATLICKGSLNSTPEPTAGSAVAGQVQINDCNTI
jgi:type II secretory pathway pseudopilin PulG